MDTFNGRDHLVAFVRNLQEVSGLKSGIWQFQRLGTSNRHIADVYTDHRSCPTKNGLGQMTFATTKLQDKSVANEPLEASAQNPVPEA
jgi:hypothetical protein